MEPVEAKPTKTTFVYDARTGKVVHVHQFIPYEPNGTISDREMEEMALSQAHAAFERSSLRVIHYGRELELSPDRRYRVDVTTRKLIVEAAPTRPSQERSRRSAPARQAQARLAKKRTTKRR